MKHLTEAFLQYQNQIKILHWQTKSYAKHQAFGAFYDSFGENIDMFIEVYMGKYGRIQLESHAIEICNLKDLDIEAFIDALEQFLGSMTKCFPDPLDSDLLNIRDEMLGDFNQMKYLLTLE